MSRDDRYDDFDELLRSALQDEADTITPGGDGLARIQQRVQQRGVRARWLRPALALGSAAVLAGLGVGAAIFVNHSGDDSVQITSPSDSNTPAPSETPSNQNVSDLGPFPIQAIFPFTDATAEQGWQQDYDNGGTTWEADPTQVATRWVQGYLDQPTVDHVISVADDNGDKVVTLGRVLQGEGNNLFAVTAVHLTKYDDAWIVTGANDPNNYMTISSPAPGSTIKTPVTVTGPGFGADEGIQLEVRDATSDTSYGTANLTVGNGIPEWSQGIDFNRASSPIGALVAVDISNADGGPARIVAEQVQFSPAAPNQPPPYFYAVKDNRITQFASRTGSPIHYLTMAQPGGPVSDPQVYGSDVYYIQQTGPCGSTIRTVPTSADGGANGQIVASSDTGYLITGFGNGANAQESVRYSLFETSCDPARSPQAKMVMNEGEHANTIDFDALPPEIVGDPSYEPQNLVDAFVLTGTAGYVAGFDTFKSNTPTPNRNVCPGLGPDEGQAKAIEVDSSGQLWIALQTGTSMDVVRCTAAGKVKQAFTIPGNDQPADIDVTSDGSAVLLTDANGKVWRWDGSGNPVELSPNLPLTQVSW
jgi:hypothetical protein